MLVDLSCGGAGETVIQFLHVSDLLHFEAMGHEVENILHQNGNCDEISFENKRVPNVFVRLCKCMP